MSRVSNLILSVLLYNYFRKEVAVCFANKVLICHTGLLLALTTTTITTTTTTITITFKC